MAEEKEKTCQCEGVIPFVLSRQVSPIVVKCVGFNDRGQERWEFTCDHNGNGKKDKREPSEIVIMQDQCRFVSKLSCDSDNDKENDTKPNGCKSEEALKRVAKDAQFKCLAQTRKTEKWSCTLNGKTHVSPLTKPAKLVKWASQSCRNGPEQAECRFGSILNLIASKARFTCDVVDGKKEQWTCVTEDGRTKKSPLTCSSNFQFYDSLIYIFSIKENQEMGSSRVPFPWSRWTMHIQLPRA